MLSEDLIRKLTLEAIEQLGEQATTANVQRVVQTAVTRMEAGSNPLLNTGASSSRIMITAYGYNAPGIIHGITEILARHRCDILDMSQKLLQEFFTLMMLVDIGRSESEYATVFEELSALGTRLNIRVLVQHEDVFNAMHRI